RQSDASIRTTVWDPSETQLNKQGTFLSDDVYSIRFANGVFTVRSGLWSIGWPAGNAMRHPAYRFAGPAPAAVFVAWRNVGFLLGVGCDSGALFTMKNLRIRQ